MANRGPELVDPRLIKAIEHPLRMEILSILLVGPSSPARIERQLDNVSLNLVSHHIKVLKETGCIELVETVSKRGAKESIYRATRSFVLTDEVFEQLPPELRHPTTAAILRVLSKDLASALSTGKFEARSDRHLSRTPLRLDEAGWEEVRDVLARTLDELLEIGEKNSKRLAETGDTGFPATAGILLFPRSVPDA